MKKTENIGTSDSPQEELPALVTALLEEAFELNATDIHIDPVSNGSYRVCCRVDGAIQQRRTLPEKHGRHLVNQIKVAARLPTDHSFVPLEDRLSVERSLGQREVRVTVVPTSRGEAAHLRILSPPDEVLQPTDLGMSESALSLVRSTLHRPEGLIFIVGPTGAGKTVTLYSLASMLDLESLIAVSIEDPVEYDLAYVRQIQTDVSHDFAMQEALRTVLRMDPDIILVGEVRDARSAITAVRAAAAGRFVLATLHAGDAAMAIEACHYFSVPRHLLWSTLRLIVSQVLVRRICPDCATRRKPSRIETEEFKNAGIEPPAAVPVPVGCAECHNFGYKGRTGIFQVAAIDKPLRNALASGKDAETTRRVLAENDVPSLRREALLKVAAGVTSLEEVAGIHMPGHIAVN